MVGRGEQVETMLENNADKVDALIKKAAADKRVGLPPEYFMQQTDELPFPGRLRIEPTNFCNIKCSICPSQALVASKKGFMNISLFESILGELEKISPGRSFFLTMYLGGEPLMHKQLCEMLVRAYDPCISCSVH